MGYFASFTHNKKSLLSFWNMNLKEGERKRVNYEICALKQ